MKKVFSNSEIVHKFNEQSQQEGRTSNGSMFFYGKKIYSYGYHYLLCEFIDNNTVIINNDGYSNTTAKHINYIINATSNRKQFYKSETETETVLITIKKCLSKLTRARKTKNFYINSITKLYKNYIEYLEYTKTKTKTSKLKEYKQIVKLYNEFKNNLDNLKETILKEEKRQNKLELERIKINLKKWRDFEIDYFTNKTGKDFLRYIPIVEQVQTSQGVKVNIEEVKRVCKLIDRKSAIGNKVNNSYLITACNGIFKAGCHNIDIEEINRIRKQINI